MTATLTPHQLDVLVDVYKLTNKSGFVREVSEKYIGSRTALAHLIQKGYIEIKRVERGPRGGTTRFFVPTKLGAARASAKIIRDRGTS